MSKKELSDAQLQQRRNAAKKSTGPRTAEGKASSSRNAVKHSLYAKGMLKNGAFKPCRSTCPDYKTCEHVIGNETQAGGRCLDRKHLLHAYDAILSAIQSGEGENLQAIAAAEMAATLATVQSLRDDIAERGSVLLRPMVNKEGVPIVDADGKPVGDVVLHPAVMALPKLLEQMGLSLPQFLATPQAKAKVQHNEEVLESAALLFGRLGGGLRNDATVIDVDALDA